MDCSPFLNWRQVRCSSAHEQAVVFRSLVATLKSQPALDASLEGRAVKFLKYLYPVIQSSADAFLGSFESSSDNSSTSFEQCFVVLISSSSQDITTTTMKLLYDLFLHCSAKNLLLLVKADLISELVITLNLQSLSFTEAVDIHINVMKYIRRSLSLTTPNYLALLGIKDDNEQQAVHETVLKQVVTPSEKYIWHLCVNRYSIVDGELSLTFLDLLAQLIRWEWSKKRGEQRQMGKTMHRMLRTEGIEDVIEKQLQHDQQTRCGGDIVDNLIEWNNEQGMNLPELW
ncbi:hypothetical protein BLNAU_8055 [Blattamonas nauphoetae]|uniref:Uncharacterized protein n=1 Tax=Blattamonas nauphoetae TaxID=2049346 RepID=A0ABQ9XZT3_9EUKA|nr:hypothetical protein BLNAU_8055 [Blattamonas nauphoetae]